MTSIWEILKSCKNYVEKLRYEIDLISLMRKVTLFIFKYFLYADTFIYHRGTMKHNIIITGLIFDWILNYFLSFSSLRLFYICFEFFSNKLFFYFAFDYAIDDYVFKQSLPKSFLILINKIDIKNILNLGILFVIPFNISFITSYNYERIWY